MLFVKHAKQQTYKLNCQGDTVRFLLLAAAAMIFCTYDAQANPWAEPRPDIIIQETFTVRDNISISRSWEHARFRAALSCTKHALEPDWATFDILETNQLKEQRLHANGRYEWFVVYETKASVVCVQ